MTTQPAPLQALLHPLRRDVAAEHIHDAHCCWAGCYDATIEQHTGRPTGDDYERADQLLAALALVPAAAAERGREAGNALTEVRTVLSRARTARDALDPPREYHRLPKPPSPPGTLDMGAPPPDYDRPMGHDPEIAAMRAALDEVIGLLSRWEKTGKTRRWVTPVDEPAGGAQ